MDIHLTTYNTHEDTITIIHTHPPTTTNFNVTNIKIKTTLLTKTIVNLKNKIPTLPFEIPKNKTQIKHLIHYLQHYDTIILKNHKILTINQNIKQTYLQLKLIKHLTKIQSITRQLDNINKLTNHQMKTLLKKRKSTNLNTKTQKLSDLPPTN